MASHSKSSYFDLYLAVSLQNGVLNWLQTWIGMFLNRLTVSSDSSYPFREGCKPAKQERRRRRIEEDGEMGVFYNLSKILKLMPFILIIDGTFKGCHRKFLIKV